MWRSSRPVLTAHRTPRCFISRNKSKSAVTTGGVSKWSTRVPSKSVLSSLIITRKERNIEGRQRCDPLFGEGSRAYSRPARTKHNFRTMKSAYELAMERLEKSAPTAKLTEAQKKEIAEIDSMVRAKIAEREVFLKDQIAKAQASGKYEEIAELEQELARDIR